MTAETCKKLDQVRRAFRRLAALHCLRHAEISEAINQADHALMLGIYTDSLRELAVDCKPLWTESESQFLHVCEDLNLSFPTVDESVRFIASESFRRVVNSDLHYLEALGNLDGIAWEQIHDSQPGDLEGAKELSQLVNAIWLYEELTENNGQRYKKLSGRRAITELEADTLLQMQQWLEKFGIE